MEGSRLLSKKRTIKTGRSFCSPVVVAVRADTVKLVVSRGYSEKKRTAISEEELGRSKPL
jgi:hypothetical protein